MFHPTFKIEIPTVSKPVLSDFKKKQVLQNELFVLLGQEDMRKTNLPRYKIFLKKHRLHHSKESVTLWEKCKEKDCKKIPAINSKQSLGFFTCYVKYDDMYALISKVKDMLNREESPTCYVYSLNSLSTVAR